MKTGWRSLFENVCSGDGSGSGRKFPVSGLYKLGMCSLDAAVSFLWCSWMLAVMALSSAGILFQGSEQEPTLVDNIRLSLTPQLLLLSQILQQDQGNKSMGEGVYLAL